MKSRKIVRSIVGLLLVFFCNPVWVLGEAYTADILINNSVMYTCQGNFTENGEICIKTNRFFGCDGQTVVTEDVRFQRNTFQPITVTLSNQQTGRLEKLVKNDQGYLLQYRNMAGADLQEKCINENGLVMHSSYVPMFISTKMDEICNGANIKFQLLVIDRLASYEFQVRQGGITNIDGQECIEVVLEPTSWFVKQFVEPFCFYYPKNKNQIGRYHGVIAPRDANGNPQTGDIIFHYFTD